MRLIEAEAKQLLKEAGIPVSDFIVIKQGEPLPGRLKFPLMLKAQTLSGGRGKAGLIKQAADMIELSKQLEILWGSHYEKRPFDAILLEPKLAVAREYYLAFSFDTLTRSAVFVASKFGGMDIEMVSKRQPGGVIKQAIDVSKPFDAGLITNTLLQAGFKEETVNRLLKIAEQMYQCFTGNDTELVEINPLVETKEGAFVAADAKIILDDTALFRHKFPFPRRTGFRELTDMEKKAREIDAQSHRGVAGRTLLELDGDIAFLSSGGGASITCLDALITYGGRPANFAEYSGNPERERVYKLTKLVLSKPGLRGFWLVGPTANFTDVYETLGGVMDALKELKPIYPIVMRRAGPRDQEAKEMVLQTAKEFALDVSFFGEEMPMTESAKVLMDKLS